LKKRQGALPTHYISNAQKDMPNSRLMRAEDVARLEHLKDWHTNEPRLYNMLVNNCRLGFRDLIYLLDKFPDTYRFKLLSDYNFDSLIERILRSSRSVDIKEESLNKKGNLKGKINRQEPYSFAVAVTMFNRSADYIINYMPAAFGDSLRRQIFPFVTLVNSIAQFANSTLKTKFPYISIPSTLIPTELPGSNPFGYNPNLMQ